MDTGDNDEKSMEGEDVPDSSVKQPSLVLFFVF
jgi:hypothetical protein